MTAKGPAICKTPLALLMAFCSGPCHLQPALFDKQTMVFSPRNRPASLAKPPMLLLLQGRIQRSEGGGCTYVVVEGGAGGCPRENFWEKEAFMRILERIVKQLKAKSVIKHYFYCSMPNANFKFINIPSKFSYI